MTHKIVGKYSNNEVTEIFRDAVVCDGKHLEEGDIVEVDGHYVRMYRDGHTDGLRYWFITELVLEAMVQRHMPAARAQSGAILAAVGATVEAVR